MLQNAVQICDRCDDAAWPVEVVEHLPTAAVDDVPEPQREAHRMLCVLGNRPASIRVIYQKGRGAEHGQYTDLELAAEVACRASKDKTVSGAYVGINPIHEIFGQDIRVNGELRRGKTIN